MQSVVLKFGGASVATPEKLDKVAGLIAIKRQERPNLVVVVSAMGGHTDELMALAKRVHEKPPEREMDMLISVGERISIALLAMALSKRGIDAISFTGSQSGIITTCDHSNARIVEVRPHRILKALEDSKVVIVAGFQGVSTAGEITTLGRGGSDTSAVAIAVAIGSDHVEFYKDVAGIYNTDPKKDTGAKLFDHLSYEEAHQIMRSGSKVLQGRCVELAEKNRLLLKVLSFDKELRESFIGTSIGDRGLVSSCKCYEE